MILFMYCLAAVIGLTGWGFSLTKSIIPGILIGAVAWSWLHLIIDRMVKS